MKKLLLIIFSITLINCQQAEKKLEKVESMSLLEIHVKKKDSIIEILQITENKINLSNSKEEKNTLRKTIWNNCPKYWKESKIVDSILEIENKKVIDSLKKTLSNISINDIFLKEILDEYLSPNDSLLTIEKNIFSIFNLKKDSIGVYAEENYSHSRKKEKQLLERTSYFKDTEKDIIASGKTYNYNEVIDSLFETKPKIFIYSKDTIYTSNIESFGVSKSECLNYFYYNCKVDSISRKEKKFLFGSSLKLELSYGNYPKIDLLLKNRFNNYCADCPSDFDKLKTFSHLTNHPKIYFAYTQNNNNENIDDLNLPVRSLIYVHENRVITLWSENIDLFGCSCL